MGCSACLLIMNYRNATMSSCGLKHVGNGFQDQVKRQPPNEEMSCVWERFLQDIDSCPDCLLMEMLSLGMITSPVYYAHVGQRSQAPATLASSPVTPAAEIPAASQETARRSTAGAQVLSNPVAPPGTRPCGTATSGLSASQVTGADQVPGVPSKVSNSSEACQDASACDSAARRPAVLCQREVKRPRRETPHNQEQSGKGAEVYRRILTWQGEPERTTLPSEAPAPGQPPLCFYAVYSAMCPRGRGAGITGSTAAGYPVPVDEQCNTRVFHFTPFYLCTECTKLNMKHDSWRCRKNRHNVRSFRVTVPCYTDEGRRMREEAAKQQQGSCQWMAAFPQDWKQKKLKDDKTRYGDCAGKQFWVNFNDLALFEENKKET